METHHQPPPTLTDLRRYRDDILAIADRHGISNVRVFGSVARGQAINTSDIDLLVTQDWSRLSAWGGMGFIVEVEELLGYEVDVTTVEELKPRIRARVLKEAIPL